MIPPAPGEPSSTLDPRMCRSADGLEGDLTFDLYGRFAAIRAAIAANRTAGQTFSVLDVGGRGNLTRRFLPEDRVLFLDPNVESSDENFIEGDGCAIPAANGSFDWVVSTDVFEHVPQERRSLFLAEQLRTARLGVILIAPFFTPAVRQAEINVNENFRVLNDGRDHPWLREHIQNGLPDAALFESCLRERGLAFHASGNNCLRLWQLLIGIEFLVASTCDDGARSALREFNLYYNTVVHPHDHGEPSYRRVYLIEKSGSLRAPAPGREPIGDELYLEVTRRAVDLAAAALRAQSRHAPPTAQSTPAASGAREPQRGRCSRNCWFRRGTCHPIAS